MILYFADRMMNIKGQASTALLKGLQIVEDSKTEDVETGVASFECSISFDDKNRLRLEEMTNAGNYLLRSKDGENEFYTIIDTEIDTKRKEVYIYAEDAGLDLLNEIAGAYEADQSYPIDHYVNRWIYDSGFEIGINEAPATTTRKLSWTGESSVTERLASIATQFGGYEISYSFEVKGMEVSRKFVNIHKKRGQENGIQLRLNREIDQIITKKSVANLATAFVCTGGTIEQSNTVLEATTASGTPKVKYTVDLETASRTASTVKITASIRAALTSENAEFGEDYGLKASIYIGGSWHSATIKATDKENKREWTGTTRHSTEISFTVSGVSKGMVTFSDIKFKVDRTDSEGGSAGILAETACGKYTVTNYVTGGENGEDLNSRPITLEGYEYDDGDFYVGGDGVLRSRNAVAKWSRYVWNKEPNQLASAAGHIWKKYSYDTASQETLCAHAITELKKVCDMEINFEIELKRLPEGVKIGDRVDVIDDAGQLYLSTRILKLETSEVDNQQSATLGEHLIKDSGIKQKVEELATQFSEIAKSRVFYTWVAYADDENGTGISRLPDNKDYIGIAANRLKKTVDISDPSIFAWSKIKGDKGEPGTPGESGTSVVSILDQYYLSTSSTECVGGEWQTTLPEWSSGHYIWERKAVTWSDGNTTYTDPILNSALNHANEAAEFAQQQANTAAQSATAAERAANNADTAAQEAASKATQAESLAQTASDTATQAKSEAAAAQSSADEAREDITQINNDIEDVKKDLAEGLETVTDTISADYAKKTDLVEIEGSLQAQISTNAAELSITHSAIEEIKIDASEAVKNANAAQTMAFAAQSTADNAKTAADKAQEFANASSQAAQTAQAEATAAQTAANTAKTAAEKAQAVADAADNDLQEAKANLEAVKNNAQSTEEDIAAAQEAVNTALTAAIKAKADAITAQSEARIAQIKADSATRNAATAQQAAVQAQADATAAKTAADKAQEDAQAILDDLATMGDKVTQAETNIKKNADAIALTATKQEVTQQLNGYYTKNEADAKFNVTADYVSSVVQSKVESVKIGGRNLIIRSTETVGYYIGTDGSVANASACSISDYIEIEPNTDYMFTKTTGINDNYFRFAWYDSEKNYLGRIAKANNEFLWTSPGNAQYIRISYPSECAVKFEKGNKATGWSPAPEDMATAEELADVNSTASSAESAVAQLAESINFLVSNDDGGGSFFKQDANGNWYFTSAKTKEEIEAISKVIADLKKSSEDGTAEVKKQLEEINKMSNYVQISTDGENPYIELGRKTSQYKTRITDTYVAYYHGTMELARFDTEGLTADKVTARKELNAVGVVFRKKSNGYVGVGLF